MEIAPAIVGEDLRPRHRTPAVVLHLVHPLHKDPKVGKWCEVINEEGERIFDGLFSACWRLVNNMKNSEVTEYGDFTIQECEYTPPKDTPFIGVI